MGKVYNFNFFILFFILLSVYAFVFSGSGFFERAKFIKNQKNLEKRIALLKEESIRLKMLRRFYSEGGQLKSDIVEHGYIQKGNKYIFFKGVESFNNKKKLINKKHNSPETQFIPIHYLRIIWIVFSILILLFFLSMQMKKARESK